MKKSEIPPVYQQALAFFEAFRRLGFPAEDIYVASDSAGVLAVLLRTQGLEFVAPVGVIDLTGWEERWIAIVEAMQSGRISDADLDEIWGESWVHRHSIDLLTALLMKGIKVPKLEANRAQHMN